MYSDFDKLKLQLKDVNFAEHFHISTLLGHFVILFGHFTSFALGYLITVSI